MVRQYDVVMIDLDQVLEKEKGKYQPCIIVSNHQFNRIMKTVWAVPITSRKKRYPADVENETAEGLIYGVVDCSEIRSLDIEYRPFKNKDRLKHSCIAEVNQRIKSILNL